MQTSITHFAKITFGLLVTILLLGSGSNLQAQTTRYVKTVATGTGDGSSWTDASANLQAMIDASASGDAVWVAAGTYKPTAYPTGCSGCSSNRDFTFYIKDGVSIYGGFAGTENTLAERNIATNTTILSADIGTVNNNSDNCHHVAVTITPNGGTGVTIDGFTMTGGNANGSSLVTVNGELLYRNAGPGLFVVKGTNTIRNNTISGNTTPNDGGGIYMYLSTSTLINNLVTKNTGSGAAAGMFINTCTTTLINNTISENVTNGNGGGIVIGNSGTAVLINNIFWNNKKGGNAAVAGADYYRTSNATVTFKNNLLQLASTNYTTTGSGTYDLGTDAANNIFATNPLFIDATNGDFSIRVNSPAINTGNDSIWTTTGLTTDLVSNTRPVGVVDMGAYENTCTSIITPSVTIASDDADNTIIAGTSVTFTATLTNSSGTPSYQWKKNGTNVGTNAATYTSLVLSNGDIITVEITTTDGCVPFVTSNAITMTVNVFSSTITPACSNDGGIVISTSTGNLSEVRYVRIQQNKNDFLHLAEVRAIQAFTGTNVALNKTVTTQSTYSGYPNSNFVDGNSNTFGHSAVAGTNQFFEIDLGGTYLLDKIQIVNRSSCCQDRANNLLLIFKDASGNTLYSQQINAQGQAASAYTTDWNVTDVAWADAATTLNRTNLAAGDYTLNYSDANSISSSHIFTVPTLTPVTPSVVITSDDADNSITTGTSVTFTATPTNGGSAPSYQWKKNGNNVGTDATTYTDATLADNDVITVEMTSNETCVSTATATSNDIIMTVCTPVTPSVTIASNDADNSIIAGTSVTFTATPINGGSTPTYQWKKNGNNVGTDDPTYIDANLINGDVITVQMTSNETCASPTTATSNSITMAINCPVLTIDHTTTKVNCVGGNDGGITITVTGGTAPYTYVWSNGSTTKDLTNLTVGTYRVTATDANGCTKFKVITVIGRNATIITPNVTNVSCFGKANGKIVLAINGVSPFTYAWSNGSTARYLSNITAGTYTVTVTNAFGCQTVSTMTVTQPTEMVVTPTIVGAPISTTVGSITLSVTGGTAPYTYLWDNGSTASSRTNLARGFYNVTVTDNKGCYKSLRILVPYTTGPFSAKDNVVITETETEAEYEIEEIEQIEEVEATAENTTLNLYPNPANNFFNVTIDNEQMQEAQISIFSSLGQLMHTETTTQNKTIIPTERWANGVYRVQIRMEDKVQTLTVIIQH
jgi:hypothetical protein